jgi:hypothetical protein
MRTMKDLSFSYITAVEVLESRIAPASVFTFTDVDGDKVTIKSSLGDLTGKATLVSAGAGEQLQLLDLTAAGFSGAELTVKVKKAAGGDGQVNIGYINATGIDLRKISVPGDVGQLDVGSGTIGIPAIESIKVSSIGKYGTSTQDAGDLRWDIEGDVFTFAVSGNVFGAQITVQGAVGEVTIGKSLIGDSNSQSGSFRAFGPLGIVQIGGDLIGGRGNDSGVIESVDGGIALLTIGGSFLAGSGNVAGMISAALDIGDLKIGGDFRGGTSDFAGLIRSLAGEIGDLTLGGSLIGGTAIMTGHVTAAQSIGNIKIGGSIEGGSGNMSGSLKALDGLIGNVKVGGDIAGAGGNESGEIFAKSLMGKVSVKGDVRGGSGDFSGNVQSDATIKNVTVAGSLIGGIATRSGMIYGAAGIEEVSVGGYVKGGAGNTSGSILAPMGAIASVTIGKSLVGGTNDQTGFVFAGLDLGPVKIGGDIVGGDAIVGRAADRTGAIEGQTIASVSVGGSIYAGTNRDSSLARSGSIQADLSIGSIKVKGSVVGNETHNVGITARGEAVPTATQNLAIGKIKIGGDVVSTRIIAGVDLLYAYVNGDAQIGPVKIAGDWVASSLAAGIDPTEGGNFANDDDIVIPGGTIGRIASIQVTGLIIGSDTPGDHFGFVAASIGSFTNGTVTFNPSSATPVLELAPESSDVSVRIV